MKERPILFSGPMVQAILAGIKTQTRRLVKPGTPDDWKASPYGAISDRLWVREAWRTSPLFNDKPPRDLPDSAPLRYEADESLRGAWAGYGYGDQGKFRPPMFMPRWASRITLEVTDVRVERLQDISEEDARSEGAEPQILHATFGYGLPRGGDHDYARGFRNLWNSINGAGSWDANPWVWVVSFKRV